MKGVHVYDGIYRRRSSQTVLCEMFILSIYVQDHYVGLRISMQTWHTATDTNQPLLGLSCKFEI